MASALPIIDMSADDEKTASLIGDAARNVGFFYVAGHGIDPALIETVFAGSARFFALPVEVKQRQSIQRSAHNRGYVAISEESLDPTKPADLKEAFTDIPHMTGVGAPDWAISACRATLDAGRGAKDARHEPRRLAASP